MSAHMIFRYRRKPVAVIKLSAIIEGAYDGMAVICDDGAVFASWPDGDKPRVWEEGNPVPGTVRDMNLQRLQMPSWSSHGLRRSGSRRKRKPRSGESYDGAGRL